MDVKEYPVLMETDLPLPIFIKGKVRDTYDLGNLLLIVAPTEYPHSMSSCPAASPTKGGY